MNFFYSETLSITDFDGFHIIQDHVGTNHHQPWDDYNYIVTFKIFRVLNKSLLKIGEIKLLVNGFENTSKYIKENSEATEDHKIFRIENIFDISKSVSLGTSLDYYRKLHKLFDGDEEEITSFLSLLCDASFNIDRLEELSGREGFSTAILRDGSKQRSILRNGYQIALGRYRPKSEFPLVVDSLEDTFEPVSFFFDNDREIDRTGINIVIGKNGVGKTHILKHIARVVTGLEGSISDWPSINKLIVMAYSPFEDFYTKGELLKRLEEKYNKNKPNKKQTINAKLMKINEYAYIGFRDDSDKFDLELPKSLCVKSIISILEYDKENSWWYDGSRLKMLFDTLSLSIDFDSIQIQMKGDEVLSLDKNDLVDITDHKSKIKEKYGLTFMKENEVVELSSGQLIYSYMLPALVSEIEPESLLIIDEPELYLHPSIEVGLIKMLSFLLKVTKSYAIIATHSSVLTREVESRAVTLLRKNEGVTRAFSPTIETYGASLDLISGEAFDDYETTKPFQLSIKSLIKQYDGDIKKIIDTHSKELGDDALFYLSSISDGEDADIELEEK